MPWIESHQELGQHPKTRRAAKRLGVSRPAIVGHLHYLWWWALDYAQDGDLSGFDDDEIAEAALWDGHAAEFVTVLHEVGFIDRADGRDALHDWDEYAGRLVQQRRANAEKQKNWRERHKATGESNVTTPDQTAESNVTATLPSALPLRSGATVPNPTVPDLTEQNRTEEQDPPSPPVGGVPSAGRGNAVARFVDGFREKSGGSDPDNLGRYAKALAEFESRVGRVRFDKCLANFFTDVWASEQGFSPSCFLGQSADRWDPLVKLPRGRASPAVPTLPGQSALAQSSAKREERFRALRESRSQQADQ